MLTNSPRSMRGRPSRRGKKQDLQSVGPIALLLLAILLASAARSQTVQPHRPRASGAGTTTAPPALASPEVPPTVEIRYPLQRADAAFVVGSNLSVSFWVDRAQVSELRPLELWLDEQLLAVRTTPDPFDLTGLPEGVHRLELRLRSPTGATLARDDVTIDVDSERAAALVVPQSTDGISFRPSGIDLGYLPRPTEADIQAAGGGIPPCWSHNPKRYHALWDPIRNCYHDHEHKDDPARVDDVFGALWSWLPDRHRTELSTRQQIGHPWETWSGLDAGEPPTPGNFENDLKHRGFGWIVRRPDDYPGFECYSAFSDLCITHHRYLYHAVGGLPGALTRTHSLWLEARVCHESEPTRCGIIRSGGHLDFGELRVDSEHVPLAIDPAAIHDNGRRLHGGVEQAVSSCSQRTSPGTRSTGWSRSPFEERPSDRRIQTGSINSASSALTRLAVTSPTETCRSRT